MEVETIENKGKQIIEIAYDWFEAWEEKNISKILALQAENFSLTSSLALRMYPASNGKISGYETLKLFYEMVLFEYPDTKYNVQEVMLEKNTAVVFYTNKATNAKIISKIKVNEKGEIEQVESSYV